MKQFKRLSIYIIFSLVISGIVLFSIKDAHAVRVSLKRVVFEGNKKSEVITIINATNEEQTYRLGWRKYKMDEGKSLRAINEGEDASGILWADNMVRFAPRRITVPAGGSQQIRILLRRPKDLADAEYRSHLWIVTEAKPAKFDVNRENPEGQAIRLSIQPAISLPVFVRNGDLTASASITNTKLSNTNDGLNVSFTLNRDGNKSIYGDFDFICQDGGKEVVLKQIRGIAVYTEITKRNLDFDLPLNAETVTSCNNVSIVYRADPDDPDFKGAVLAEAAATR